MAAQKAKKRGDILEVTGATLAKPSPKKKGAVAPKVPGKAVPPKVKAKPKAAKPKAKPELAEAKPVSEPVVAAVPEPAVEDFGKCEACGAPRVKLQYDSRNYPDFYTITCNNRDCPKYRWIVGHQGEVPPGVRLPPGA